MSRIRMLAAGMLLAVFAVLASAAPAAAHDELVSSDPEVGDRLSAGPEQVSLMFSDEPLALDGAGLAVVVVDAAGRDWVDEDPSASEQTVTARLGAGMPEAGYELRWRVVSADGHPISGVIPFTIGDAEPLAAGSETDTADGGDTGRTQTQVQEQSAQETQQAIRVVLLGVGGAAIAVIVFVIINFFRRRRGDGSGTPEA